MRVDLSKINHRDFVDRFGSKVQEVAKKSDLPKDQFIASVPKDVPPEASPVTVDLMRHMTALSAIPNQPVGIPTLLGAQVLREMLKIGPDDLFSREREDPEPRHNPEMEARIKAADERLGNQIPNVPIRYVKMDVTGGCNGQEIMVGGGYGIGNDHILGFTIAHEKSHIRHRDNLHSGSDQVLTDILPKNTDSHYYWKTQSDGLSREVEHRADREGFEEAVQAGYDGPTIMSWIGNLVGSGRNPRGRVRQSKLKEFVEQKGEPIPESTWEKIDKKTMNLRHQSLKADETVGGPFPRL